MTEHRHTFVETYDGLVAFGFSREVDEKSLMYYLQKFSQDDLMQTLVPRLTDREIGALFDLMSDLMRKHFTDEEYHRYFLDDPDHHHHDDEEGAPEA
jgi:hypothetical protein